MGLVNNETGCEMEFSLSSLGRYVSISEDEAKHFWGEDYMKYYSHRPTGFTAG